MKFQHSSERFEEIWTNAGTGENVWTLARPEVKIQQDETTMSGRLDWADMILENVFKALKRSFDMTERKKVLQRHLERNRY